MSRRRLAACLVAAVPLLPAVFTAATVAAPAAAVAAERPGPRLSAHWRHVAALRRKAHLAHLRVLAARRAASSERARVVKAAKSYIGTPYVDGGMSRAGVDCSALVDLSYRVVGRRLPRTTQGLARVGRDVTGHARVGDYILYGTTHAAIVAAVSRGRVTNTLVARHAGTRVQYQTPYAAYTVRAVLA